MTESRKIEIVCNHLWLPKSSLQESIYSVRKLDQKISDQVESAPTIQEQWQRSCAKRFSVSRENGFTEQIPWIVSS